MSTSYNYQIRAENVPGAGGWSANLLVATPTVPVKMAVPVSVSIDPARVETSWTFITALADTGYDPI
jgi:hypothetical protein